MIPFARLGTVALCTALAIACGGSSSSKSPTAPPVQNSNQWLVFGQFSILTTPFLARNLLVSEFLVDGVLEQRYTSASQADMSADFRVSKFMSSGRHVITVKVAQQVTSPHGYETTGILIFARGQDTINFDCPVQHRSVVTGGELSCAFTLP